MKNCRPPLPIARPCFGEREWQALREPLESGWLTQGPKVAAFERAFAARHGVRHAVATTSCTTALHVMLLGLGVGPGDEVVVPAFTWVATANAVVYCGARPVFADVDEATFNIDPACVAALVTERTRAVVPVHLFGLCADTQALAEAAPGLPLLCDAACAVAGARGGVPAGALGRAAAFSFHPRKPLSTGEGGMVTTDDDALAEHLRVLVNHGASVSEEARHCGPQPWLLPDFDELGYNYRMTDMQGAVGLVQLERLEEMMREREALAAAYAEALDGLDWLRPPQAGPGQTHGWQAYVCFVDPERAPLPRDQIMAALAERGVSTRPGTHAVHELGYYRRTMGTDPGDCPRASRCARQSMALPFFNGMTADDCRFVAGALRGI